MANNNSLSHNHYTVYIDEAKRLIYEIIERAAKDFLALSHATSISDRYDYETACQFLFNDDYKIDYGGVDKSFEDLADIIDLDIHWIREVIMKGKDKLIKEQREKIIMSPKKKTVVYLAGPMEYANNNGLDWRLQYKPKLLELGISRCIIPNHEEAELVKDPQAFNKLKETNPKEFNKIMEQLAEKDIGFVHEADFIIIRWMGERMSGTIGEAHEAKYHAKTPCYLVTNQARADIPGWFFTCMDQVFSIEEELFAFLSKKLA